MNPSSQANHFIGFPWRVASILLDTVIVILLLTRIANGPILGFIALLGLVFGMVNTYLGIRGSKPVWSAVHFGLAGMSLLFWIPAAFQNPLLSWLLYCLLLVFLIGIGSRIWRSADIFWMALSLFPSALFAIRIWQIDFMAWNLSWSWIMAVLALAIYSLAIALISIRERYRWEILVSAMILYFGLTLIANSGALNLPAQLRSLPFVAILAASPFLAGWGQIRFGKWQWVWAIAGCLLGLSLLPWYSADIKHDTSHASGSGRPVIIDTDMSHDDIVAILYLLQRTDLDVRAITVGNGVAHVENGAENLRRLLTLAERDAILTASGSASPLSEKNSFPPGLRTTIDYAFRPGLPLAAKLASKTSAPDLIRQQLESAPEPVLVIALGPLTNLALALRAEPGLISKIDTIVISGGAIHVPGVTYEEDPSIPNKVSELNLFVDPVAASEVSTSGARLELVPLDVINTTGSHPILTSRAFIAKFAATANTRSTRLMADIMQEWLDSSYPKTDAVPLWDAPVAAIATDPNICSDWQELAIQIQSGDISTDGQTLVTNDKPNMRVCLGGDQAAFDAVYMAVAK